MPHILKIYRDFTKGLAPFSLDEILKRERIWKVFLLLCSLLAFGFIFLLKMEFFANDIWRITIQLNFSVYAWKPESFCAVSLTSVLSTCHYQAEEGLEMEGRGVSVDIVKEIQGEKERIRGKLFTEQGSHGTGQINVTAAWSISLPIQQEAENKFYILLTQVRITLAYFQSCWDDQLMGL